MEPEDRPGPGPEEGGGTPDGWTWQPARVGAAVLAVSGATVGLWTMGAGADADAGPAPTRIEVYASELAADEEGGGATAEAWLASGRRALRSPVAVTLPFRDRGELPPDELAAHGYRFPLREGQVVEARVDAPRATSWFVELHRLPADTSAPPAYVAEADSLGAPLEHEARRDGEFVLRIVPEPFGGATYAVEISARAAFAFPVAERGPRSIISQMGDPREGGRRSHEGVDIIAPAGTPVLAATRALVHRVGRSPRGGNYVWLQDWAREKNVYYAHLQRSWVDVGMVVEPGEGIGTVGSTGNASGPHLHFAIYDLDRRPSDPLPFIVPPEAVREAEAERER